MMSSLALGREGHIIWGCMHRARVISHTINVVIIVVDHDITGGLLSRQVAFVADGHRPIERDVVYWDRSSDGGVGDGGGCASIYMIHVA